MHLKVNACRDIGLVVRAALHWGLILGLEFTRFILIASVPPCVKEDRTELMPDVPGGTTEPVVWGTCPTELVLQCCWDAGPVATVRKIQKQLLGCVRSHSKKQGDRMQMPNPKWKIWQMPKIEIKTQTKWKPLGGLNGTSKSVCVGGSSAHRSCEVILETVS